MNACLPTGRPAYLTPYPPFYELVSVSVLLFHLSVFLACSSPIHLTVCLSGSPSIILSVVQCLSGSLSVRPSVRPSISLSVLSALRKMVRKGTCKQR